MRRKNYRLMCFISPILFALPSMTAYGQIYLGGSVGASFASLGNNNPQITYLSGALITDDYPLKENHQVAPVYSVHGGFELAQVTGGPTLDLGLGVYGNLSNYHFKGRVVETAEGDPSDTLYGYKYHVSSTRLMAEAQINWALSQAPYLNGLSPFINVGIGPSWNKMSGYHEMSFNDTSYPPLPPFDSGTKSRFAFQAGCGLSKTFHLLHAQSNKASDRVAVGYRYANMGKTSFGKRGSVYPYRLSTGSLQNNEVYFSYTHLF